jgi:hypothetical protein
MYRVKEDGLQKALSVTWLRGQQPTSMIEMSSLRGRADKNTTGALSENSIRSEWGTCPSKIRALTRRAQTARR